MQARQQNVINKHLSTRASDAISFEFRGWQIKKLDYYGSVFYFVRLWNIETNQ